jgi:hypothetical protein
MAWRQVSRLGACLQRVELLAPQCLAPVGLSRSYAEYRELKRTPLYDFHIQHGGTVPLIFRLHPTSDSVLNAYLRADGFTQRTRRKRTQRTQHGCNVVAPQMQGLANHCRKKNLASHASVLDSLVTSLCELLPGLGSSRCRVLVGHGRSTSKQCGPACACGHAAPQRRNLHTGRGMHVYAVVGTRTNTFQTKCTI